MRELSDYLMKHHFDVMVNETIPNVDDAALEVIMEQDDALTEAYRIIKYYARDDPEPAEEWLRNYPTPPAQAGGK